MTNEINDYIVQYISVLDKKVMTSLVSAANEQHAKDQVLAKHWDVENIINVKKYETYKPIC